MMDRLAPRSTGALAGSAITANATMVVAVSSPTSNVLAPSATTAASGRAIRVTPSPSR
ncbi:hypothetical protein ABZ527_18405 [Streptomyces griseofuscus]|uniref:hypothetical protein n=1 Tax=Streptomyces griseofuscus TaxID=146922 RepID=UPI0033D7D47E